MSVRSNEESLELFADLLEPFSEIFADPELAKLHQMNAKNVVIAKTAIKNHKKAVIEILALIDGVSVEEYKINPLNLFVKVVQFLNKPEVGELFTSQGQKSGGKFFGSVTESTEGAEN